MLPVLEVLIAGLVNRDAPRTEADLQAQVRQLLVTAQLNLENDLRLISVRTDAVAQLKGYVEARQQKFGCRYVGVLTDGAEWFCYHLRDGELVEVAKRRRDSTTRAREVSTRRSGTRGAALPHCC